MRSGPLGLPVSAGLPSSAAWTEPTIANAAEATKVLNARRSLMRSFSRRVRPAKCSVSEGLARVVRPGERPLRSHADRDLEAAFERALAAGDGVAGAHVIHERWMRGHFPALIEAAIERLWKRAAASIP